MCAGPLDQFLQTKGLGSPAFGPNGDLFWLEGRPLEQGRQVLVRKPAGPGSSAADVTPPPDSGLAVRTCVQEYGGGAYLVGESAVYFSNFKCAGCHLGMLALGRLGMLVGDRSVGLLCWFCCWFDARRARCALGNAQQHYTWLINRAVGVPPS